MSDELKKMYKTMMDDHFPPQITMDFGDQNSFTAKGLGK